MTIFAVKTAPTGSGMPAQAFRSSMPGQAFDQYRGSGLDRERARLSVWRIADRASPRQGKSGEHQGYGRHERPFSRSRPLPQGRACQSWRSGRPCQIRRTTKSVGAVSTANGHGSAFGALLTGPRPRQGKSGEHQGYGRHERPFSRSRPLPQGQACQSRRSGRPRRLRRRLLGRL